MADTTTQKDYQKGFNEGYLLAGHHPFLAGKLSLVKGSSPRLEGLRDGIDEFIFEKGKEDFSKKFKNYIADKEDMPKGKSREDFDKE